MLKALIHGKTRWHLDSGQSQIPGASGYGLNEDCLTAAVFARFAYLPARIWWPLLKKAAVTSNGLPDEVGELEDIKFWPRWDVREEAADHFGQRHVQPDVYLRFSQLTVLVEAKRYDAAEMQRSRQLAAEYVAWTASDENDRDGAPCIVLAIGGLKRLDARQIQRLCGEMQQDVSSLNSDLRPPFLAAIEWSGMLTELIRLQESRTSTDHCSRSIIADLISALELHSIHPRFWLIDLPEDTKSCRPINDLSIGLLRRLCGHPRDSLWMKDLSSPTRIRTSSIELFSKWRT